ncbi:MAG: transposase, partial [Sandaracinaceae bacterium]|nr:transposase [Sandaracinaceae bacterium]
MPIDNGLTERLFRRIAIVRKNALFVGSHAGGDAPQSSSSILATSRTLGINPAMYRGHPADAGARLSIGGGSPTAHAGRVDRCAPRRPRPAHERAARHRVRVANRAATRRSSAQTERRV